MIKTHYSVNHCGIVILAAGGSTRLGRPKQLLSFKGQSLISHAVDTALKANIKPVVVVTGANHDKIIKKLNNKSIHTIENKKWQEGIASSLRVGVEVVTVISPEIDGIIFMVCDQPYITSALLNDLLLKQNETKLPIVASYYDDILGTPALFHKKFFPELLDLDGDTGAGKLIKSYKQLAATVDFPAGSIDIDTGEDFESLLKDE